VCGIAGILAFAPSDEAELDRRLDQMVSALGHRGPDGRHKTLHRTTTGGCLLLGHARLAILDLTDAARQPMTRGASTVTFNGEIYNFRNLRAALADKAGAFRTGSDTEVLLAAHETWGESFLQRLDGMFAFGLWDGRAERLQLVRDRFGIKPLYYAQTTRAFVFASEVRALLASGLVTAALDLESVWHYVGYQTTPTPRTLIQGVWMLEPATVLDVTAGGVTSTRTYWSLLESASREPVPSSRDAAMIRVGQLLRESVDEHLVSDVPVAAFLSGGIDSGAIVSAMTAAGSKPRTFTVSLDDNALDESAAAAATARHFATDHTTIRLSGSDLADELPAILAATDHPSGDAVNTWVVSRAVHQQGLKVALSGLGGDEVFGGYPSFRHLRRAAGPAGQLGRTPAVMRRAAASIVRTAGGGAVLSEKAAAVLDGDGSLAEMWPVTRQLYSDAARRRMMSPAVPRAADAYAGMLSAALRAHGAATCHAQVSFAESRAYMHDVLLRDTDQVSMAHGLEVRVPLLDYRLAVFVAALPDAWVAEGSPKALLVDALERPLPDAVARAPKRGFVLPLDAWMRGPLKGFCEAQLGPRGLDARGLLIPGEAARLWNAFLARSRGVTWSRVWTLVALNAWLEERSL